jgi:hopene-associated glycosyltransferase HpnB
LSQNYAGVIKVIVVDDNSDDGTAKAAGKSPNLRIIHGKPLEQGWTGKLWAVHQGILEIDQFIPDADYVLLTDADIEHHKDNLSELVYKAVIDNRLLVSLMVKLRCVSIWEKLLIPAFVYFFQKLYPFPLVNSRTNGTSAAAGGCMLIRMDTLRQVGGTEAIKDRLIDDCAIGALIKQQGSIWLGLSERTKSLRSYTDLSEIWHMVTRTAFVQLNHSMLNLLLTVIAMILIYLAPPLLFIFGLIISDPIIWISAGSAYLVMGLLYQPTLSLYEMSVLNFCFLPLAGLIYILMTVSSAIRYWQGKGGVWKGRSYSNSRFQG